MTTAAKRGSKTTSARRRGSPAISREKRAAYVELKQGVKHLEKSIGEIQKGLRRAERQIEADARAQVRALRIDARTQLALVKEKQREAVREAEDRIGCSGGLVARGEAVGGRDPGRCRRYRRVGGRAAPKGTHGTVIGASARTRRPVRNHIGEAHASHQL